MVLCKRPAVFLSLAVLLSSLTACASSPVAKNLEDSLAADPRLQNNSVIFGKAKQTEPQQLPQSTVQLPADFPLLFRFIPMPNYKKLHPQVMVYQLVG